MYSNSIKLTIKQTFRQNSQSIENRGVEKDNHLIFVKNIVKVQEVYIMRGYKIYFHLII